MNNPRTAEITLAGQRIPDAYDSIRRYCGLAWSGGPPETWAFAYYDGISSEPTELSPVDVVSAAALHPGLSGSDLAFFVDERRRLEVWLSDLPMDLDLRDADDGVIGHIATLSEMAAGPSLTLLTKVLHRKRPRLVPLIDRHVVERYRHLSGERRAVEAWPSMIGLLRDDLRGASGDLLDSWSARVSGETNLSVSSLRLLDIAIWMDGGRR